MSTYSDHEQRLLDQQSGAELDRLAQRREAPTSKQSIAVRAGEAFVAKFKREPSTASDAAWLNGYADRDAVETPVALSESCLPGRGEICPCGKHYGEHPANPPFWPCMVSSQSKTGCEP